MGVEFRRTVVSTVGRQILPTEAKIIIFYVKSFYVLAKSNTSLNLIIE